MRPWTVYPTTTNKPNVKVNDAGGDILVIGGIHGDEPCGWTAIREFYRENYDSLTRPVTFLIANTRAAQAGKRYLETDLNRSFGNGYDADDEAYEMRLAEEIQPLAAQFEIVISLHSTHSTNEPFAIFGPPVSENALKLLQRVGISKAIHVARENQRGSLIALPNVIEFECGFQHSQDAVVNAKRIIKDSVAYIDGLENHSPTPQNDVRVFKLLHPVPKPTEEFTLHISNLQTVQKGDLVLETNTRKFFAPESFAPILMSENGYADILGYRGIESGWLTEGEYSYHPRNQSIITKLEFPTEKSA